MLPGAKIAARQSLLLRQACPSKPPLVAILKSESVMDRAAVVTLDATRHTFDPYRTLLFQQRERLLNDRLLSVRRATQDVVVADFAVAIPKFWWLESATHTSEHALRTLEGSGLGGL